MPVRFNHDKSMKTQSIKNLTLALVGLLALTVYILACTSFSPDDTKVLYPAFDPASGALGMAIYDREARRNDMLFLPIAHKGATNSEVAANFLRGQWVADGHSILFAWASNSDGDDNAIDLALMPWGGRASLKLFHVPGIKDAGAMLTFPLCVAGDHVFLMAGPRDAVRVDLKTGALAHHEFADAAQDVTLLPAPDGKQVFYTEKGTVFGRLDAENFRREPLMTITNELSNETFFTYDKEGKVVAFLASQGGTNRLVVLRQGETIFSRPLAAKGEELAFGNAIFSPKGDRLWATYQEPAGSNTVSYGLMEIPLSDAPLRKITLIASSPGEKDSDASFFQFGLSHDGNTAAVASTYLAVADKPIKPDDCALFFVDLSDPNRKVTKVPLPAPPRPAQKE
jgi:hypothetical protein